MKIENIEKAAIFSGIMFFWTEETLWIKVFVTNVIMLFGLYGLGCLLLELYD